MALAHPFRVRGNLYKSWLNIAIFCLPARVGHKSWPPTNVPTNWLNSSGLAWLACMQPIIERAHRAKGRRVRLAINRISPQRMERFDVPRGDHIPNDNDDRRHEQLVISTSAYHTAPVCHSSSPVGRLSIVIVSEGVVLVMAQQLVAQHSQGGTSTETYWLLFGQLDDIMSGRNKRKGKDEIRGSMENRVDTNKWE